MHVIAVATTAPQLKKLVEANKDIAFASCELVYAVGDVTDSTTGYKLLYHNLLWFLVESDMLMFYAPIVRNAISLALMLIEI